jgi:hypothetical protein
MGEHGSEESGAGSADADHIQLAVFLDAASLVMIVLMLRGGSRSRWALLGILVALALGDSLTTFVLKPLFDRPRPFIVLSDLMVFKGHWQSSNDIEVHRRSVFLPLTPSTRRRRRPVGLPFPALVAHFSFLSPCWLPFPGVYGTPLPIGCGGRRSGRAVLRRGGACLSARHGQNGFEIFQAEFRGGPQLTYLSVVIPVYNEAENLRALNRALWTRSPAGPAVLKSYMSMTAARTAPGN